MNASLKFVVTRNGAPHETATVDYATSDGTATARSDYAPARGTLTFTIGETAKTVAVAVLDDAHDEGAETLTLVLTNPRGVRIVDATATGTIANSDPLPEAWLAGFGRSVAGQVVDAVSERLEGVMAPASMGDAPLDASEAEAPRETRNAWGTVRRWPVRSPGPGGGGRFGNSSGDVVETLSARTPGAADVRNMNGHERHLGGAFHLSPRDTDGPAIAAWGRVTTGGFASHGHGADLDGDATTFVIGADVGWDRWLAGAAVAWSEGDGTYSARPGDDESGGVESTLTTLSPYLRYALNERVSLWGLAGAGTGTLSLKRNDQAPIRTDISLSMGALGVRGTLLPVSRHEGLELALRSDLLWVRTESDATHAPGRLAAARADARRLRLVLEGSRPFELESGATLTPRLEVGLRHDGGDAETGTGVELLAGIRLAAERVVLEGSVRGLIATEREGYEQWAASGTIQIDPSPFGRGLSLTVSPVVVVDSIRRERLWSVWNMSELVPGSDVEPGALLEVQIGYGLAASFAPGLLTPYTGLSVAEGGSRTLHAGVRWDVTPDIVVSLNCERQERAGVDPDHVLTQRAALRW